jgi:hypothetical protein
MLLKNCWTSSECERERERERDDGRGPRWGNVDSSMSSEKSKNGEVKKKERKKAAT